jgi:hypothetical protein
MTSNQINFQGKVETSQAENPHLNIVNEK